MPVGTLVADAHIAVESTAFVAVASLSLDGSVASTAQTDIGPTAVGLLLTSDDIDDSSHGIGAVEHAGRATEHFHLLGHHGLVGIRNRMAHQTGILWLTVDEHHELGTTSHTTNLHATCSTG